MTIWRQISRGVGALFHRDAADRDLRDEVEHYLELTAAALEREGFAPADARREARLRVGNATGVRETVRDYGWENVVDGIGADLRFAVRRLRASPGFTAVAAITLALGIGASTAIFSAVKPVLFAPLPYPHAERVVAVTDASAGQAHGDVTFGTFRELTTRGRSFAAAAVTKPWLPTVTGEGRPERLDGQAVSAGYFDVLGVVPALGRAFLPADDVPHGPHVVVLSDGLWRRRFGADASIIGRTVALDGNPFTVIGVMPPRFANVLSPAAELWEPLQYDPALPIDGREWGHHLEMVARLRPSASLDAARAELAAIAAHPVAEFSRPQWAALERGVPVVTLQQELTQGIRPALLAVIAAVLLLLVIACVNVTNLLLARATRRRTELAMRAALGAGWWRIVRQLLTESVVLALSGGAVGLGLAVVGVRALAAMAPDSLPRRDAMLVDGAAFAFALGVTALVGVAVGLVPAVAAARGDLQSALRQGSRRTAGGRQRARRALVVVEVALALVLAVGAGLLLRSVERLFAVRPGFRPTGLLTMQIQESGHRYDSDSARARFFDAALDAVRRVPGVEAAAFTSQLPLSGDFDVYGAQVSGRGEQQDSATVVPAFRYAVSPGYFATLGIPLKRGRVIDSHDVAGAPPVVVIDEALAKRAFGNEDPIGREMIQVGDAKPAYVVVGVVGDVKQASLADDDGGAVYMSPTQWHWVDMAQSLVIRTSAKPSSLVPSVRAAIWSVDRDQPIVRVATMSELVDRSEAQRHFALVLFELFAAVALVLAFTGVYGVIAGGVEERIREIGVRAALGASRAEIVGLVARQAGALVAVGAALGLVGAAFATRGLSSMLYGISALDPLTYVGVVALLAVAAAVACSVPAWRAAAVDPASTLRAE